jgi:predicted nucleic acid-binding protein
LRLLLDINVVLDVILAREPWVREAAQLLGAVETRRVQGFVAGHTLTTVHHVVRKLHGKAAATMAVTDLLRILEVVPVEQSDFQQALALSMNDFEDAVQVACGIKAGVDQLVTRDPRDFRDIPVPATSPSEALALIRAQVDALPP